MSATTPMPAPGETVPVSDGAATVVGVTDSTVTYDHSEHSTYTIGRENFMDYMESDA